MIVWNQSERRVMECEHGSAVGFGQPILQVRRDRVRHEEWPADLEQGWPLDRLHVAPEMTVIVAKVAVSAAARSRLELHRHCAAIWRLVVRSHLVQ